MDGKEFTLLNQLLSLRATLLLALSLLIYGAWNLITTTFNAEIPSAVGLLIMVVSCFVVWLPGVALASTLPTGSSETNLLIAVVIGVGVSGAFAFGFWFYDVNWGRNWALIAVLFSVILISYGGANIVTIVRPLLMAFVISMLYISIVADRYGLENANTMVANRYWVSVDNKIPQIFADALILGREKLKPYLVGDWLSSDRPPLLVGIMLSSYPFATSAIKNTLALTLGIAANIMWVFGLWAFLTAAGASRRSVSYVIVVVALTGAVFVNTIYVWPKFLAATYVLAAGALLLSSRKKISLIRCSAIGICLSFSMLSHGAAIFGIIGLIPFFFFKKLFFRFKSLIIVMTSAIVVYAPWMAYQKFFDPPGDRLIKWHLAGVIQPTSESAFKAIFDQYSAIGVAEVVDFKSRNLNVLIGLDNDKHEEHNPLEGWGDDLEGQLRIKQLFFLSLAPGVALISFLGFIAFRRDRWFKSVFITAVTSAVAYCLIEYGGNYYSTTWLHTAPYSLLLLWVALGPLIVSEHAVISKILLFFVVIFFIWLWIIGPGVAAAAKNHILASASPLMIAVQVLMIVFLVFLAVVRIPNYCKNS